MSASFNESRKYAVRPTREERKKAIAGNIVQKAAAPSKAAFYWPFALKCTTKYVYSDVFQKKSTPAWNRVIWNHCWFRAFNWLLSIIKPRLNSRLDGGLFFFLSICDAIRSKSEKKQPQQISRFIKVETEKRARKKTTHTHSHTLTTKNDKKNDKKNQ